VKATANGIKMGNLKSRLNKAKSEIDRKTGVVEKMFFFRFDPEIPSESEQRFRQENPDYKGKIFVYTLGTRNLNPYIPDVDNERS
jgi:hypothetical protein